MTRPAIDGSAEPGQTAYEARFPVRGLRAEAAEWSMLPDSIKQVWARVEAACTTLATAPPREPNPEAPTLSGPLNAVLQARADDPDRPFLSEGGGGSVGESLERLRGLSEEHVERAATPECGSKSVLPQMAIDLIVSKLPELRQLSEKARGGYYKLKKEFVFGNYIYVNHRPVASTTADNDDSGLLLAASANIVRELISVLDRAAAPKSEEEGEPRDEMGRPLTYWGRHP